MAFVFLGRLGLGNEDDFAAPQKVKVADLTDTRAVIQISTS